MRVIVTGGRNYDGWATVYKALDDLRLLSHQVHVSHGGCTGADRIAAEWCNRTPGATQQVYMAEWHRLGKAAGPARNQRMVDDGANLCVAFPGGRGTADCVRRCREAGMQVWQAAKEPLTHIINTAPRSKGS